MMSNPEKGPTPEQCAASRRLGLTFSMIALVLFLGVIFKCVVSGDQPDKRRAGR